MEVIKMDLIDTHCHLDFYGDAISEVIQRANEAHVTTLISVGTGIGDWSAHEQTTNKYPNVYYTVGIHPENVTANWELDLEQQETYFSKSTRPVAVGEIGLDYHSFSADDPNVTKKMELQQEVFLQQLKIAERHNVPVIVHCRDAFEDCKKVIDRSGFDWNKIVIHCFSEGPDEVKMLNERGGRASFTGNLTYKSAEKIRQALLTQGIDRLMFETDSPFLAPIPFRSQKNEPAHVREIVQFAANLVGISEDELAQHTTVNAKTFFTL